MSDIKKDEHFFTLGKVHQVKNGRIKNDNGFEYEDSDVIRYLSEWYEFENVEESQMFTKDDLKANDWCVLADGSLSRVAELNGEKHIVWGDRDWIPLSSYNESMELESENNQWNIQKVIRPTSAYMLKPHSYEEGKLVFDREKGIGCEPPMKEISVDEATKLLTEKFGQSVRIRVGA